MANYRRRKYRYNRRKPRNFNKNKIDYLNYVFGYGWPKKRVKSYRGIRRVLYPTRNPQYYQNKRMKRRRARLGLPPVELKYVEYNNTPATQYTAFSATDFSITKSFMSIAIGETESTRTSNYLTFLPFTYQIMMKQQVSTQHQYRVIAIKVYDMIDSASFDPENILQDTTNYQYALTSSYLRKENRGFRFKVLFDKYFVWSTHSPNPTQRIFRVKFKTNNSVTYDTGTAGGSVNRGAVFVGIITDAPDSDANYVVGGKFRLRFLDM